jgi:hypothetical protein
MRIRLLLPLLALVAAAMALHPGAADAKSRYKVGMGDQNPQIFGDPNFNSLKIKKVRVILPWDWRRATNDKYNSDPGSIQAYMDAAKRDKKDVMVAFSALRGCYNAGKYSKAKTCKAPSQKKYKASIKAFRKQYPQVKTFQPWNELNNKSQPTYKSPKLAASYYKTLKANCKKCTIVAADILDSSNAVSYVKKFQRYTKKQKPRLWGLHNYADTNRFRARITPKFLKAVKGQVWLTETGGLVKFLPNFKQSTSRANKATKYMFKLADRFSKKLRGYPSKITRLYPYTFYGYTQLTTKKVNPRFDAGLVGPLTFNPNAGYSFTYPKPRPAYKTFKKLVKSRSK